jgi:hypothetical protein
MDQPQSLQNFRNILERQLRPHFPDAACNVNLARSNIGAHSGVAGQRDIVAGQVQRPSTSPAMGMCSALRIWPLMTIFCQ